MERVALIGSPGTGKSTAARRLAVTNGLPLFHLDAEYWQPGWARPDRAAWNARHADLIKAERWILDGNYSSSQAQRLGRADTVIFLDFSRYLCVARVLSRALSLRRNARPDLAPGCKERLDLTFLRYVWQFRETERPRILRRLETFRGRLYQFETPRQLEAFLKTCEALS